MYSITKLKSILPLYFFFNSYFLLAQSFSYQSEEILKERNPSFFEKNKEISTILIGAVRNGKITPYTQPEQGQESKKMLLSSFEQNMKIPVIKGALITDDKDAISFPENAKWFPKDINVLRFYWETPQKIKYLSLYVHFNDKNIFIANFRFKDVQKVLKKSKQALWESPPNASFGEVLHIDIDDGSAYQIAKTLLNSQKIQHEFANKIEDESLSYQWLVRPVEKQDTKRKYSINAIEIYYESDTTQHQIATFEFAKVKDLLTVKDNYLLNYVEALQQRLFVSQAGNMPLPVRKEKMTKLFQKEVISDLNLKDKENITLFQEGGELVKYLLEAVRSNAINVYANDSLKTKLSQKEFELAMLDVPPMSIEDSLADEAKAWRVRQLYKLNLIEDMRFDQLGKQKSYEPKAISIILPAQENTLKGIDEPLVYFSYREMMKLLKKKKLKSMISLFQDRSFKVIPLFMRGIQY